MPNHLANRPIVNCHTSPTGKAYQSTTGGCSCNPVTPGLNDDQREVWLGLYNAWNTLVVQSAILNCEELLHLGEQVTTLRDVIFEWDGAKLTTHKIPQYSFELLGAIANRLDAIDNDLTTGDGTIIEIAESLDDLSYRVVKLHP